MHFPIIELNTERKAAIDWMTVETLWDDALIESHTDYTQDITKTERKEWLRWLPKFFEGIADVDLENETITFKSREEIEKVLDSYYREIVEKMAETEKKGWSRFYDIRRYGECFRDADALFYFDNGSYTSMQIIEDSYLYAGETLYIGGVVDAHV